MIVNKYFTQSLYKIKFILLDKKHPITWEPPTTKSVRITSHSLFEVIDKLDLFEIIHLNYLNLVCTH